MKGIPRYSLLVKVACSRCVPVRCVETTIQINSWKNTNQLFHINNTNFYSFQVVSLQLSNQLVQINNTNSTSTLWWSAPNHWGNFRITTCHLGSPKEVAGPTTNKPMLLRGFQISKRWQNEAIPQIFLGNLTFTCPQKTRSAAFGMIWGISTTAS